MAHVLIETLWNVKLDTRSSGTALYLVLIETLWNVKFFYDGIWRDRPDRINRNIVECKARSYKNKRRLYTVLIETLWNVKF